MKSGKYRILETIRQGRTGGGESHVYDLCTHLDPDYCEPVVLSFSDGVMVDRLQKKGIRTKVIETETPFDLRVWRRVTEFVRNGSFDLIHAHGSRAMSNLFYTAKRLHLPLIYTVHGWSFHPDQPAFVQALRKLSEHLLTRWADHTICVSKSNEQTGIDQVHLQRSTVIHNAVNTEHFNPAKVNGRVRSELGIAPNKTVIGYIVRMTGQKDPLTMIHAMKKVCETHPDTILLMVGEGPLLQQAINLVETLGLNKNVIFSKFRSDIPAVLEAVDIYCLPSLWEGFPIGILEAMAMKKCVIATPVDGTAEQVEDSVTGLLVPPQQPHALACAIIRVIDNPAFYRALTENAFSRVISRFDIQTMANTVQATYRRIITDSRRTGGAYV